MQNYGQPVYDRPGSTTSFAGQQAPSVPPYQQQQQWGQQPPQQQQPSAPGYNPGTYGAMPSGYSQVNQVQTTGYKLLPCCADSRHSIQRILSHQTPTPSNRTATFHLHLHLSRTVSQPRCRSKTSTTFSMRRIRRALRIGSRHSKEIQALCNKHSKVAILYTTILHLHHLLLHQLARISLHHKADGQGLCMARIRLVSPPLRCINGRAAPS